MGDGSLETALLSYRARPCDQTFSRVYATSLAWLNSASASTIRRYSSLCLDADLDYVVNEGAFALGRAARRFVYFCPVCADTFIQRRDLVVHGRQAHRIRGLIELVPLKTFALVNARYTIGDNARQLHVPECLLEYEAPGVDRSVETRLIIQILVRAAIDRMSAAAKALVLRILAGDVAETLDVTPLVLELRQHLAELHDQPQLSAWSL